MVLTLSPAIITLLIGIFATCLLTFLVAKYAGNYALDMFFVGVVITAILTCAVGAIGERAKAIEHAKEAALQEAQRVATLAESLPPEWKSLYDHVGASPKNRVDSTCPIRSAITTEMFDNIKPTDENKLTLDQCDLIVDSCCFSDEVNFSSCKSGIARKMIDFVRRDFDIGGK